jgi:hypothetical protein
MTKTVSQLDALGYFVGPIDADASPLEPNVYLIPGGAVDSPPPSIPDGKVARWDGGWVFENPPTPVTIPAPDVSAPPPQITEAQAAKLIAFLKANPDIVEAAQL